MHDAIVIAAFKRQDQSIFKRSFRSARETTSEYFYKVMRLLNSEYDSDDIIHLTIYRKFERGLGVIWDQFERQR